MNGLPHVTMDPSVRFPSTWRAPIGAVLTGKRVLELAREGFYGERWKKLSLAAQRKYLVRKGRIMYCEHCRQETGVKFMRFSYLPKTGYYCPVCRELFRSDAEKDKETTAAFRSRIKQEYV